MIINIDDTFFIEKDNYRNHTLKEKTGKFTTDKYGQSIEVVRTHGHHSTVAKALESLTHLKLYRTHLEVSLSEYIQMLKNERVELEKLTGEEI